MILDYPYIEVYMPNDIKYITDNYINRNRREIIKEYQEEYPESEAHLVTIMNVWDNALKGKDFGKQHIRGIKSLTQILFWEQKNLDVDVHNKILKILNPKYIKEELVRRNLHWRDVYEEDKDSIFKSYIYIICFDRCKWLGSIR